MNTTSKLEKRIFSFLNKYKYVIIFIFFATIIFISFLQFMLNMNGYVVNGWKIQTYRDFLIKQSNNLGIGAITFNFNFGDFNFYVPKWDEYFTKLGQNIYSFLGLGVNHILTALQNVILFLSGIGIINKIVFSQGDHSFLGISVYFWYFYLIAFIIYIIIISINILNVVREREDQDKKRYAIVGFAKGTLAMVLCLIIVPGIFISIDLLIYVSLEAIMSLTDEGFKPIGQILFGSSFTDRVHGFIPLPPASSMFPGPDYLINGTLNDVVVIVFIDDIPVPFHLAWFLPWLFPIKINLEYQAPALFPDVKNFNFILFYISEIVTLFFLIRISIRLITNSFSLVFLFISGPIFFSTTTLNNHTFIAWMKKVSLICLSTIIIFTTFIIFSQVLPILIVKLSQSIDDDPSNSWLGVLNIMIIFAGLYSSILFDNQFQKAMEKREVNVTSSTSSTNINNNSKSKNNKNITDNENILNNNSNDYLFDSNVDFIENINEQNSQTDNNNEVNNQVNNEVNNQTNNEIRDDEDIIDIQDVIKGDDNE